MIDLSGSISQGGMAHMHLSVKLTPEARELLEKIRKGAVSYEELLNMLPPEKEKVMSTHERILTYTKLAARGVKSECKWFYFDEGLKFIVDGQRMKMLPLDYQKLYLKDEFWIHINPVDKRVMYYAYDMSGERHVREEDGHIPWNDVEDCIYNFFVLNINSIAMYSERDLGGVRNGSAMRLVPLNEEVVSHTPPITLTAAVAQPCPKAYYGLDNCTCGKCKTTIQQRNRNPFGY